MHRPIEMKIIRDYRQCLEYLYELPVVIYVGRPVQRDQPKPVPVDAEADEVAASDRQVAIDISALGDVADVGIAPMRALAENLEATRGRWQETEYQAQQRGLSTAVGAQHGDEFSGVDGEGCIPPDEPVPISRGQSVGDDGGGGRTGHVARYCRPSAARRVFSCLVCQSWKEAFAGWTVSEMPTTGMPFLAASCLRFSVMGVEVCVL